MASQIGIAYTPIPIVDFILQSVNDVLKEEFDRTLSSEDVHILDPFAGTGSFLVRMFEMNLLREEDLARKYSHEIHANEMALLPYYIAAINIENAYFAKMPVGTTYHSCPGICLADTFQMMEWDEEKEGKEHLDKSQFPLTSEQIIKQKKTPITVIV
ncbi:MAG TPA: N-6 DNA methylase, partial [Methanocorpusculum sp.]|nr:N-6 DNA methylase [Methanocorpusculum sp.]